MEEEKRDAIDPEECFKRLGLSRTKGYEEIRAGRIPSLRFGRRIIIPLAQLRKLLEGADVK